MGTNFVTGPKSSSTILMKSFSFGALRPSGTSYNSPVLEDFRGTFKIMRSARKVWSTMASTTLEQFEIRLGVVVKETIKIHYLVF